MAMRVIACVFALCLMLVPQMPAASAATAAPIVTHISVAPRQVWTNTGVALRSGDAVTIRASGRIHFGDSPIDKLTPAGIRRGTPCNAITSHKGPGATVWPAPQLDCWALIGRIGVGPPFAIGNARTFRVATKGVLALGVNDNYLPDNSGTWKATVSVTAPPKHSKNVLLFALVGAVVLAAIIAIVALVVRSRTAGEHKPRDPRKPRESSKPREPKARREPKAARKPKAPRKPKDVTAAAVAAGSVAAPPRRSGIAPGVNDSEFTEVNIFEVEFSDRASLRVGYNYFPEGTVVHWRVAQRAKPAASGEFVTNGGGNMYHFVTIPLGVELEPDPDGADVNFTWAIGSVPFHYSVRRDPAR
ncbi:MAG: hypothetical protein M3Q30_10200 [Actinomycetota bacterium]|nr:hypothetical protein [Actinomycetota bacterium]